MQNNDKTKFDYAVSNMQIITSAAATEHVIEMNGNARKYQGKTLSKLRDGKVYLGDEEIGVNAHSFVSPYAYKYAIRMDEKPVIWKHIKNLDPNLRMTKGLYMIKYTPKGSKDHRKGRPFKIGQDLIRWDIRVSGKIEWHELCDRLPELKWLERNSTLSDGLFDLAVKHPGMSFWFSVDWLRYEEKLKAQAKNGLEENRAFVSRKCSVKEYRDVLKAKDKEVLLRYYNDILTEINDVERLETVQNEMKETCGEGYDRSRKLPRDPVTGQFISKKQMQEQEQEQEQEVEE